VLDMKFIRENPEAVKRGAGLKGVDVDVDALLELDKRWRKALREVETMRSTRNSVSDEIGRRRREGEDASDAIEEMRRLSARIKELDAEVRDVERLIHEHMVGLPNLPHDSVPHGADEGSNVELRRWGRPPKFSFEPRPHWEIGASLGILDMERAARMAGSRFALYIGAGALLERALINFMLDLHVVEHGYTEVFPPFLANRDSMFTTGQLPKFEEDMFRVQGRDLYMIPTAEVPLTNLHSGEILDGSQLPLYYSAYTACFRAEAGAGGRDTRGIIRNHQFNKVELVKFALPETSYEELESLTRDAEEVLQRLGLPYRAVTLCTGDMTFSAAKTIDLEVWLPGHGEYKEISSCSNFEDFQARRGDIRFRRSAGEKPEYVHTLNGSGLAVGRTLAAILENFQQEDGSVIVPEALRPYMRGTAAIEPPESASPWSP